MQDKVDIGRIIEFGGVDLVKATGYASCLFDGAGSVFTVFVSKLKEDLGI